MSRAGSVLQLPLAETVTADQALADAAKQGFGDVLVVGYVGTGLFWRTSRMTKAEAVFLLEAAKMAILGDET